MHKNPMHKYAVCISNDEKFIIHANKSKMRFNNFFNNLILFSMYFE